MQKISESAELDLETLELRKFLVALDDSEECDRALAWSLEHLYRFDQQLGSAKG